MASTYLRKTSPWVWLNYKAPDGTWKNKPTQYRKDNPGDRRQAELLADRESVREREQTPSSTREHWDAWVDGWLSDTYGQSQSTTPTVYRRYWKHWRAWLNTKSISAPVQFSIHHTIEYRRFREGQGIGVNTIIHELKFMGRVMKRAMQLGFATVNPCAALGLKKAPKREKEPWTDEEASSVAAAMHTQPDWLQASFILGYYQAARLRQCEVPLRDIDLKRMRITYWRSLAGRPLTKGNKPFTHPIASAALPLLRELIERRTAAGSKSLCDIDTPIPSTVWRTFLDSLSLPHLCHHGLRVTWITRAAESGKISLAQAKRFVNHGSTAVHEIYQRLNADDIAHVGDALDLPSLSPREPVPA